MTRRSNLSVAASCLAVLLLGCSGGTDLETGQDTTTAPLDSAEQSTSTTTTTTTTTTTVPVDPELQAEDDRRIAQAAVMTAADLPTGWAPYGPTRFYLDDELDQHICGSDDVLPPHTAGFDAQFSRSAPVDALESGHMVHAVFLAPTEADAAREFAAVESAGYEECTTASLARSAGREGDLMQSEMVHGQLPGDAPGVVDRFTLNYLPRPDCSCDSYVAFVRMQVGRAIVRLPITTYDRHLTDEELQPIVDTVHALVLDALAQELD